MCSNKCVNSELWNRLSRNCSALYLSWNYKITSWMAFSAMQTVMDHDSWSNEIEFFGNNSWISALKPQISATLYKQADQIVWIVTYIYTSSYSVSRGTFCLMFQWFGKLHFVVFTKTFKPSLNPSPKSLQYFCK